jgi:hypothetical protein
MNRLFAAILLVAIAAFASGCSTTTCRESLLSSAPGPEVTAHLWHRVCGSVSGYTVQVLPSAETPRAETPTSDPSIVFAVGCDCPTPAVAPPYRFEFVPPDLLRIIYVESPEIPRESFGLYRAVGTIGTMRIEYDPPVRLRPLN